MIHSLNIKFFIVAMAILLFFPSNLSSQTNEGKEFWFGFMEHIDVNFNSKVAMITSKTATTGMVSIPGTGWSESFSVLANEVTIIKLPNNAEFVGSERIEGIGARVTSVDPVSVYIHQFSGFRSEATVVLPNESLGKEYYVMAYRGVSIQGSSHPSEFLIVATEDETIITITVASSTEGGLPQGAEININLNRGEAYQVQARNSSGDVTGSHIIADKNIAVFGGNSWTEVPNGCSARDNLLEQMYPVDTWGKQFVSVPNRDVSFDVYRILASENNTTVTVTNSSSTSYNLDAGEFVEYQESEASYIIGSKPILVAQYNAGFQCTGNSIGDPSMMLLNTIEQTRDTVTLYNSSFQNIVRNFINVIMYTSDVPFITMDGASIASYANVEVLQSNPQFSYVRALVGAGAHTIISQGCGVIASAYGYGEAESYSYSGGASFAKINANLIPEGGCLNDTIFFDTGLNEPRHSFEWDLGDGTLTTEGVFQHFYENLGSYPVRLIVTDHCFNEVDTFYRDLKITLRQEVDALDLIELCEGETIQLEATDLSGAMYEWNGPNAYFSEEQFPFIENTIPGQSGFYDVIGIISGCATHPATTEVIIHPPPKPKLGSDTFVCSFDEDVVLEPGDYSFYEWQDGSTSSIYSVSHEGDYMVTVTDEHGCVGADSVYVLERCPTRIFTANIFSPNRDGVNDDFCVQGHDIISLDFNVFDRWGNLVFHSSHPADCWE
jgi:hypothetical protein